MVSETKMKDPEYKLQITARNERLGLGELFGSLMVGDDLSQTDYLRIMETFAQKEKDLLCRKTLSKLDTVFGNFNQPQRRSLVISSLEAGDLVIDSFPGQLLDGRLAKEDIEYKSLLNGTYPVFRVKDISRVQPGEYFLSSKIS